MNGLNYYDKLLMGPTDGMGANPAFAPNRKEVISQW